MKILKYFFCIFLIFIFTFYLPNYNTVFALEESTDNHIDIDPDLINEFYYVPEWVSLLVQLAVASGSDWLEQLAFKLALSYWADNNIIHDTDLENPEYVHDNTIDYLTPYKIMAPERMISGSQNVSADDTRINTKEDYITTIKGMLCPYNEEGDHIVESENLPSHALLEWTTRFISAIRNPLSPVEDLDLDTPIEIAQRALECDKEDGALGTPKYEGNTDANCIRWLGNCGATSNSGEDSSSLWIQPSQRDPFDLTMAKTADMTIEDQAESPISNDDKQKLEEEHGYVTLETPYVLKDTYKPEDIDGRLKSRFCTPFSCDDKNRNHLYKSYYLGSKKFEYCKAYPHQLQERDIPESWPNSPYSDEKCVYPSQM